MQRIGFIHGTGAALNIELGFIPDYVMLVNVTDGDKIHHCFFGKVIVFTSGSEEIKPGFWIKGITSQARARVREVILDSGSWAGGDAAGWLVCNAEDITGTIQSENAEVFETEPIDNTAATNDLGVVVDVEFGVDVDTEVASATGNNGCLSYVGDSSNHYAKGITVGSTISENGKLLAYVALANSPGNGQGPRVLGNLQSTVW